MDDDSEYFSIQGKTAPLSVIENPDVGIPFRDMRKATRLALFAMRGQRHKNADTGWEISIGRKGIEKTLSEGKAAAHFLALGKLPELLCNAVLVKKSGDRKGRKNVDAYYRLYAPIRIGTSLYAAQITVSESTGGEKRFYLQRLQIEKPAVLRGAGNALAHVAALRPAGSPVSISQLLAEVKSEDANRFTSQYIPASVRCQLRRRLSNFYRRFQKEKNMRTALFIGGTGTISMSVTQRMAAGKAWKVVLLNRGKTNRPLPGGVETLTADINNDAEVRAALAGRNFDVVADFIAFRPEQVERDIELFSGRTGQYIFISSASAYQKPTASLPITESTPLYNPFWQYSRDKMLCEHALMRAYRENGFPVTIVRPSHTYDYRNCPLALNGKQRGWQTVLRVREGKPVIVHGDGTSLWTLTHAEDFAVGFGGLMGDPRTVGHAFHITSDDVLAWNTILGLLAGALGTKPNLLHIATDRIIKNNPGYEGPLLGDKAHSVIFDNTKIRRFVPEFRPVIKYADAVHRIVETMTSTPALQIPDPEFDAWCDMMAAKE